MEQSWAIILFLACHESCSPSSPWTHSYPHVCGVGPFKFQLAVLSFEITPFNDQSKGQDVVVTCRQTPDTPLLPLCLHVYNDTDSHLSDHITYTQHRTPKVISVGYGFEAQTVLYVLSTNRGSI